MTTSRRTFFHQLLATAGSAALLELPLAEKLFASPEPQRNPIIPGAIRLNSNENAYGPLPSAMNAMQKALARGNRYPFADYGPLIGAIAKSHGAKPEQVLIGAGSTEILRICAQVFLSRDKNLVVSDPTFEALVEMSRSFVGAKVRQVPLTSTYAHDLDAMLKATDANTGLVYICNPNNPTASITPAADIEAFLAKLPLKTTLLIDEAYHHFAMGMPGYRSFMDRASDNVIIMRTFSKVYGMAGIRLGYAVSSELTIKLMSTVRLPVSVNTLAAAGGLASLQVDDEMRAAAERNAADRAEFAKQANQRGITFIPSYANFLMLKAGRPAQDVIAAFQENKILIGRPFPPMTNFIRVSLGLPEENSQFWQSWDQIQKKQSG